MFTMKEFAFETPLYTKKDLPDDLGLKGILAGYYSGKVDGYCPQCGKETTFSFRSYYSVRKDILNKKILEDVGYNKLEMVCSRDSVHKIKYWYILEKLTVEKVGQYPSLADIANDEAATYRSVLTKDNSNELHKAIGLAAHGVGIGSFVYLRRIFERIINERFNSLKKSEGWDEADFNKLRMDKKVKHLEGHIPDFLVENLKIYSILSKGIHELSEEECLNLFEPLKLSLKMILEDDKKKQDDDELRKKTSKAIKSIKY